MTYVIAITTDPTPCFAIRRAVFMDEQGISEPEEFDDLDAVATHVLATQDGVPVGAARLLFDGATGKIGRVCVLPQARGTGLGADLIRFALAHFEHRGDISRAYLSAQVYAIGFYERLGFTAYGEDYDDAGIPHRDMALLFE